MASGSNSIWVEEASIAFTLTELSQVCRADAQQLVALVEEGVLHAEGTEPESWRFDGSTLSRALSALRLSRDFDLSPAGTALALDLLAQIKVLRSRLRHRGED